MDLLAPLPSMEPREEESPVRMERRLVRWEARGEEESTSPSRELMEVIWPSATSRSDTTVVVEVLVVVASEDVDFVVVAVLVVDFADVVVVVPVVVFSLVDAVCKTVD